jgi:hypothetical protein
MHKAFYNPDFVTWLYALNALMVLVDIGLYLRNRTLRPAPPPRD